MRKVSSLLLTFWVLAQGLATAQNNGLLQVHFVDVGQGDAIWIQGPKGECTPNGLNIIIDGGPNSGANNRLITYLEAYKFVKESIVDFAVITHPHDDHYPGMTDILKNYQVKTIIDSGFPAEGVKFQEFLTLAKAEKVGGVSATLVEMRKQPTFQFPPCVDLKMTVVYGDSNVAGLGSGNSRVNNASTVVRIDYKSMSFLFMGDLEGKNRDDDPSTLSFGEKALLAKAAPATLKATVLKVGHHGSKTSSTLSLIRAVQPDVVVIQSGRKPFNGTFLPDTGILDLYKKERPGAVIVRTDDGDEAEGLNTMTDADGDDIAVLTDGNSLTVKQAKLVRGKRQWVTVKTIQK